MSKWRMFSISSNKRDRVEKEQKKSVKLAKQNILSREDLLTDESAKYQDTFVHSDEPLDENLRLVIEKIHSTLKTNSDATKAKMKLPGLGEVNSDILAIAIEKLLVSYFHIVLPTQERDRIEQGRPVQFVQGSDELPDRTVVIVFKHDKRMLGIFGAPPEDGRHDHA